MTTLESIARAAYLWIYSEANRLGFERALWTDWVNRARLSSESA